MKAQFATIEAGIAFALIVSAISFAASLVNSSTAALSAQSESRSESIAAYDILNAVGNNYTYNSCLAQANGSAPCVSAMEQSFETIFQLSRLQISGQGGDCSSVGIIGTNASETVCVSFA